MPVKKNPLINFVFSVLSGVWASSLALASSASSAAAAAIAACLAFFSINASALRASLSILASFYKKYKQNK